MTRKQKHQTEISPPRRIALATSSLLSVLGIGAIIFFDYSHTALFITLGSLAFSLGSYLHHHIKSGNYLPEVKEKKLRQKLISLKFKLGDQYEEILENSLEAERKMKGKYKLLDKVLLKFFTKGELTYKRYKNAGSASLMAVESNLATIAEKMETIQYVESEENKKRLIQKIESSLIEIEKLFQAYENLIMSFEACEIEKDRDDIFMQLEELAKRTEKYRNL